MTDPDVLVELDRWITEWRGSGDFRHPRLPQLERARDEIVRLRYACVNMALEIQMLRDTPAAPPGPSDNEETP